MYYLKSGHDDVALVGVYLMYVGTNFDCFGSLSYPVLGLLIYLVI